MIAVKCNIPTVGIYVLERDMTKKLPKGERMEDIIQAAVDEFLEKGYDGTTMEAIAGRAGISKGGLYHHFSSKDEILLLANQKLNEPVYRIMEEAGKKNSASEALSFYIKNYLEYWTRHKREMVFYILTFAKLLDNPSLWEMYENYTENTLGFFQDLYQRGIDSGEFMPHSAHDSALTMMAAVDGIVMYMIMDKKIDAGKIVPIFQDKFIHNVQTGSFKSQKIEEE
jgi:AcrR family transcriptional regulator